MSDASKNAASAATGAAHRYRASADFTNLHAFSPLSSRSARPSSMMFEQGTPLKSTHETQVYDNWLKDLSHYQKTLEEMYSASLDQNFKEELGAIEQWFRVLSEAERTAALYTLLQQATQVQIRFLIMVLQEKARADPMSAVLSPANFNKDAMSQNMNSAMQQLSLGKHSPSPSLLRTEEQGNRAISQMFPDAAAALANQRAELQRKRSLFVPGQASVSTPSIDLTLAKSLKDDAVKSPWTPSFRKTLDGPERPKSAEPTKTAFPRSASLSMGTPLRSQRTDLNATSMPYSPFDSAAPSGSWASMTNTPATAMFPTESRQSDALQQRLAAVNQSMMADGAVNGSPRVVLESDVRKFRRATPKSPAGDLLSSAHGSPIMMYDDDGQLMSPQAAQQYASPLVQRMNASPANASTPLMPILGNARASSLSMASGAMSSWTMSPGSNASFMFPTSSPAQTARDGSFSPEVEGGRRRSSATKQVEDPTDPKLLADIPAWLRQLRLHKYTDNLKDLRWQELVHMSSDDLAAKGVSAQGARNKLLKSFGEVLEAVKSGKLKE
ncbi:hypothetical protein BCR37DRAFT_381574 [Protomyces lactucae-debilis]|uniref:RNA-binding protein VTS1 n=1 Tax=Protomyces lactucae-debilis TaxID=2754530 RepID=A0A1Y2F6C3_PROLT|nr:uncharacterized protein BCR37DRAFT_381574 [Protomyces lactucae-debilis]ORY79423.1 hypothetical protein BCR37DRAFT_381574 [Protomyces lactucae-debilis]